MPSPLRQLLDNHRIVLEEALAEHYAYTHRCEVGTSLYSISLTVC